MPAPIDHAPIPDRGYALGPDEGVPGRSADVKCSLASTGGSLALYRSVVDGQGPPLHQHVHEDETIVVLDGTLEVRCGPDTWTGGPGTTFFLPRGLPHAFASVDGPATILFLVTPGHLDELFRLRDEASDPAEVAALVQRFLT
jgi:quercetin dioxygenase-like cupin family protein